MMARGLILLGLAASVVSEATVHTIFSTECNRYFDWQSLGLVHSARTVGQKGPITRLMACNECVRRVGRRREMRRTPALCGFAHRLLGCRRVARRAAVRPACSTGAVPAQRSASATQPCGPGSTRPPRHDRGHAHAPALRGAATCTHALTRPSRHATVRTTTQV
jgi:hypothetical protein